MTQRSCTPAQFEEVRNRNGINIKFGDFAAALRKMFEGCRESSKE